MAAQSVAACLQMKCRTINELECWSQSFGLLKDKWMHVFPNRIILLRSCIPSWKIQCIGNCRSERRTDEIIKTWVSYLPILVVKVAFQTLWAILVGISRVARLRHISLTHRNYDKKCEIDNEDASTPKEIFIGELGKKKVGHNP